MSASGRDLRTHVLEEVFDADPAAVFTLLDAPSAIREWWGATRVIVIPEPGGTWAAAWGDVEDAPEYVTVATMSEFDPPRRIVMTDYRYYAKSGPLPFASEFTVTFIVEPQADGTRLRVEQHGFPHGPQGDAFLAACVAGWSDTFAGIGRYLRGRSR